MGRRPTAAVMVGVLVALLLAGWPLAAAAQVATAPDTTVGEDDVIDPVEAWAKVAEARDNAAGDRHHEAVADYLQALSHDARLVPVVAQEIAYQKLWREDAEQSIFYFRRYLARHPDKDNREVRKGLALAYSWSGRLPEAVWLYRELVAEDPSDGGARVGLARTLLWDNRLSEGWAELRRVETEFGPDDPAGREAADFALVVLDGYTPPLAFNLDFSWDSDHLDIVRIGATRSLTRQDNRLVQILPGWTHYNLPGQADIRSPALGGGYHMALRHDWNLHAYARLQHFRSDAPLYGGTDRLNWLSLSGDFWLTWLALPRLRFDFGGTSQPVETFLALNNHLHFEQANASCDYRLGRRLTAGVAGNVAAYSDGNRRSRGTARLTWKREGRWEIHAGPVLTYMDFATAYPGGYWAPDWVRSGSLEATVKTRRQHWIWRLNASLGLEKETGSDAVTVGGISVRAGWRFHPDLLANATVGHTRSSFSSASGFNRTFLNLSIQRFF